MDPISRDLARWMPVLLSTWRGGRPGPADRLDPRELDEVAGAVRRLSLGLTRKRKLVGAGYMDDRALQAAYLLYFWPVSYAQARHVLGELPGKIRTALDLGSGPGPVAFAAFDVGAREVLAADRSRRALDTAMNLARRTRRSLTVREWDPSADDTIPGGDRGWSVITLGHALNELWAGAPDRIERRAALCERLLSGLRKGGSLVLMEPALLETTRELLKLRDALVERGHAVRAPCLFRGPCPALDRPAEWCHAERPWTPPPVLAELIEAAGLHKEALKMSYVAFAPRGEAWAEPPPGRLFRVVSEFIPGKKRVRVMGCGPEGRLPLALSDAAHREENRAFELAARGDVLEVEGAEPSEEGPGLRIVHTTRVRRVARAGEPVSGGD